MSVADVKPVEPFTITESPRQSGRGLGWVTASFFIIADLVGGGVVAMPVAFIETGLAVGILFMVAICLMFAFTAVMLGKSLVILEERWPIYKIECKMPYPEMAERGCGKLWRHVTYTCAYFTMFGATIVYILLAAKIVGGFLADFGVTINYCGMLAIMSAAILPITFLKSPADFWFVVLIAMLLTISAVIMIIVSVILDGYECIKTVNYPPVSFFPALLSLGTFLFAFNGHNVFPTVQHDMYEPKDFTKSAILGFLMVALLYMPVSIVSYIVYGDSMRKSVIDSVQITWIRYAADISIAIHCILTIIITINPLNQQAEKIWNVPHKFSLKRVIVRTFMMCLMLFVALTIPDFTPVMNLFGSTFIPMACVILPLSIHLWLSAAEYDEKLGDWKKPTFRQVWQRTSRPYLYLSILIVFVTIICMVIAAYMAVQDLLTVNFKVPCYLQPLIGVTYEMFHGNDINCCGASRLIRAHPNSAECVPVPHSDNSSNALYSDMYTFFDN